MEEAAGSNARQTYVMTRDAEQEAVARSVDCNSRYR